MSRICSAGASLARACCPQPEWTPVGVVEARILPKTLESVDFGASLRRGGTGRQMRTLQASVNRSHLSAEVSEKQNGSIVRGCESTGRVPGISAGSWIETLSAKKSGASMGRGSLRGASGGAGIAVAVGVHLEALPGLRKWLRDGWISYCKLLICNDWILVQLEKFS